MIRSLLSYYLICLYCYTRGEKVTLCGGESKELKCASNERLEVVKASYGRTNPEPCSGECLNEGYCRTERWLTSCNKELNIIKEKCENKTCTISMGTEKGGLSHRINFLPGFHSYPLHQPCLSVRKKYIEIEYQCIGKTPTTTVAPKKTTVVSPTNPPDHTTTNHTELICEYYDKLIQCPPSQKLKIISVFWGRKDKTTCTSLSQYNDTTCHSGESLLHDSKAFCDNQESCQIYAHKYFLGDPCPFNSKYFEVTYQCSGPIVPVTTTLPPKAELQTRILCEGLNSIMSCPKKTINIVDAVYGRTDTTTCSSKGKTDIKQSCTTTALKYNKYQCQDFGFCYLSSSAGLYGNPCGEFVNYLNITYQCIDKEPPPITTVFIPTIITATAGSATKPYQCGKSKARSWRVIKGVDAGRGDWPWQVAFYYTKDNSFFCGGSLVSPTWIVTAAHCFGDGTKPPETYYVVVGDTDRTRIEGSERKHFMKQIKIYLGYDSSKHDDDVALVEVKPPVIFNDYVQPVCLPDSPLIAPVKDGILTGWGKTDFPGTFAKTLQKAELKSVSKDACSEKLRNAPGKPGDYITDKMLCVNNDKGKDGCKGDSGGPFVNYLNDKWELRGIVSWGSERCDINDMYLVLTRVTSYLQWIKVNTGLV